MSVGYPHLGGYSSGYGADKNKSDMYDGDRGRGNFMGGPGGMGGGERNQGPGMGAKVMVANINEKISRMDLEEKFSKYGRISGIQMQGKCAYLLFDREDCAMEAVRLEHAVLFKGCRIELSVVPDKGMGGGGPQGPRGGGGDSGGRMGDSGGRMGDSGGRMGDSGGRMGDSGGRMGDSGGRMGDSGGRMGDSGGRMGPMGRSGRRSPIGDNRGFRDRPQGMMGREDRFRDEMPGMGFEDPYMKGGFNRGGMDGEPYPKNPRFDQYMGGNFNRNEPGMPGPMEPYMEPYNKGGPPKPNDCEIIVINKNQQNYAESVEQRLRNLGLTVDLLFLREEGALTHTVDDIGRRGTLFAIVIAQQHEAHGSLTLNILQGNPQEHRNMPLDDALKLIARSFHEFVQSKKKSGSTPGANPPPPMDREIRLILTLLLEAKYVTANELERLINYLKERRERMLGDAAALQNRPPSGKASEEPNSKSVPSEQELQQRILNILGSSGGNMSANADINMASTVSNPVNQMGMPGFNDLPLSMLGANQGPPQSSQPQQQKPPAQQQSPSSNTYINFDNPSVQKALDSLIQSGPNLLKNISMGSSTGGGSGGGNPRGPGPQQKPPGMMGGPGGFNQGGYGGGGGMQPGYRHPNTNNSNNSMMGGRPQQGGPNNQGMSGFGMGRQMRY